MARHSPAALISSTEARAQELVDQHKVLCVGRHRSDGDLDRASPSKQSIAIYVGCCRRRSRAVYRVVASIAQPRIPPSLLVRCGAKARCDRPDLQVSRLAGDAGRTHRWQASA